MTDTLSQEKLDKYFDVTSRALKKVKLSNNEAGEIRKKNLNWENSAKDFLDMAQRYFDDAKYFRENGDNVTAFAALPIDAKQLDSSN